MKQPVIFFCLILGYCSISVAQNYQSFLSGKESFFTHRNVNSSQDSAIRAVKVDSFQLLGQDTMFFNFDVLDTYYGTQSWCGLQKSDTIWLGPKAIIRSDGYNIFFNRAGDSIKVNVAGGLSDTWKIYEFGNGDYINATVTDINYENVLGSIDSVKTITLQAKDGVGNNITHNFNSKEIRISQNSGFIKFYRFLVFPTDTRRYQLIGQTNPERGRVNITATEIYDFEVADEFHYKGGYHQITQSMKDFTIKKVLDKYVSGNNDTLRYTFKRQLYRKEYYMNGDSSIVIINDTIIENIIVSEAPHLATVPDQAFVSPDSTEGGDSYLFTDALYNSRTRKRVDGDFVYFKIDSCFSESLLDCPQTDDYGKGLGLVAYDLYDINDWCYSNFIVYFKKGTETWGTPLNWWQITGEESSATKLSHYIKLYPNPTMGKFEVWGLEFEVGEVQVFDLLGNIVLRTEEKKIDLSAYPAGIYFVRVGKHMQKLMLSK